MKVKVKVSRIYNGEAYEADPPRWLVESIERNIPFLRPGMNTRLVCSDVPGATLVLGQNAPCNGGYIVDVTP